MRKTVAVFIVLFALLLGYIAWPLVSLFSVLSAAQAGDTTTIEQRVNFPALRRSLSVQIVQTYARLTGAQTDRAGIAVGAAASFVDPFIGMFSMNRVTADQGSVLDVAAIVALIGWTLVEALILAAIRIFSRRTAEAV